MIRNFVIRNLVPAPLAHVPGMVLDGTVAKYRCQDWHGMDASVGTGWGQRWHRCSSWHGTGWVGGLREMVLCWVKIASLNLSNREKRFLFFFK